MYLNKQSLIPAPLGLNYSVSYVHLDKVSKCLECINNRNGTVRLTSNSFAISTKDNVGRSSLNSFKISNPRTKELALYRSFLIFCHQYVTILLLIYLYYYFIKVYAKKDIPS